MGAEVSRPGTAFSAAASYVGPIAPSRFDEFVGKDGVAAAASLQASRAVTPGGTLLEDQSTRAAQRTAAAKRPGGSGMAVPPQRSKAPGGMPMRSALAVAQMANNGGGKRLPVEEPPAPETPETSEARQERRKQELVSKLNNMVGSMPKQQVGSAAVPAVLQQPATTPSVYAPDPSQQAYWESRVSQSRVDAMEALRELRDACFNTPMKPEQVGSKVEDSLGSDLDQFTVYQSTIHGMLSSGLSDKALQDFLFDEQAERQLTTYDKWAVIRTAAEQVLQVYANRSNSSWIESEEWAAPTIVKTDAIVGGTSYAAQAERMLSRGEIAFAFFDDGRAVERGGGACGAIPEPSPLLSTDLWQAIKELAPNKVPSTQRLERLSVVGRQLLHAAVTLEMSYGAAALSRAKVVVGIDSVHEAFFASELLQWGHFGFAPPNLAVLPLPRFHGFAEDKARGTLAHVKDSAKLLMGTGYALFLTNSPAEAYTLSDGGDPRVIPDSVLGWLERSGVVWLSSGLLVDMERLRPGEMVDTDFLASALFMGDTGGANMAMEVMKGGSERDARSHDSIVLKRTSGQGGEVSLRPSCMRTVCSYQILQQHLAAEDGFYVATQRFAFKVPTLRPLLVDASQFKAEVVMQSFYAYASFDMADISSFQGVKCVCVRSRGRPGPGMIDSVLAQPWLSYVAPILELQDQVDSFRQKAVQLIRSEGLVRASSNAEASTFKERKRAYTVVVPITLEQAKMVPITIKMARLFIKNIVDRMHLLIVLGPNDTKLQANAMLHSVGDKELDFQGQIVRSVVYRGDMPKDIDSVAAYCDTHGANIVVVPSVALCAPPSDLGAASGSLAMAVCRIVTSLPVLVVKANSIGKFSNIRTMSTGSQAPAQSSGSQVLGPRNGLVAMCHLDMSHASPLIEAFGPFLCPKRDVMFLAKTQAFEPRSTQLSMRSRRMLVQARMSAPAGMRVEERAYAESALVDLPKAVEAENVDVLMIASSGGLAPSKETEDLLKSVRSCVYIHRSPGPQRALSANVDA